jgi:hypothetical protein
LFVGPSLGKRSHILETARTESLDAGKLDLQIMGQPVDDPGAPAFGSLPCQDVAADRPVEKDKLSADGKGGSNLSPFDAILQVLEQLSRCA